MSTKDFFRTILKALGILMALLFVAQTPNLVLIYIYAKFDVGDFISVAIPVVVFLVAAYILLWKYDNVINLFKLDQGFDATTINVNPNFGKVAVQVGITIVGLYLIVANAATFLTQVYYYLKQLIAGKNRTTSFDIIFDANPFDYVILLEVGFTIALGYLMLANRNRISNWIEKINQKNSDLEI